jgi:hypothetical protein
MKYYTIDQFVNYFADNGNEETLWDMIDNYKEWKREGQIGDCLLRSNAQAFCSNLKIPMRLHTEYMEHIVMGIYEHFALKYKELKND